MILDGYGLNAKAEANAIAEAKTPVMDKLMAEYPFVGGDASGLAVGLPDGQMGNSEVGHTNMGAGRPTARPDASPGTQGYSDINLSITGVFAVAIAFASAF